MNGSFFTTLVVQQWHMCQYFYSWIFSQRNENLGWQNTYTWMLMALIAIDRNWKWSQCSLVGELHKLVYHGLCHDEFYSAIKVSKLLTHSAICLDDKGIMHIKNMSKRLCMIRSWNGQLYPPRAFFFNAVMRVRDV